MSYCERTGPGLFDEPVNAATNAAFFLAAWAAWSLARQKHAISAELSVLIGLSVAVGIGSALWHTFATPWARPMDIIPILLFQLSFIWVYGRRLARLRGSVVALVLVVYLGAALLGRDRPWLNGALIYAPALVLSLIVGVYHWWARKREPLLLLAGAGAFCLALVFRTIDLWVCPSWPRGTHFLWHLFNGLVVYLAMRALIVNPWQVMDRKL
jgi:hypothetical protein